MYMHNYTILGQQYTSCCKNSGKSRRLFARVGQELITRGHIFTVLISSADETSQHTFITRKTPGMQAITFQGTAGVGALEWASRLSRDPVQVDH